VIPEDIAETLKSALYEWQDELNTRLHIYIVEDMDGALLEIEKALKWIEGMQKVVEEQNQ
jgi:hypothetical protein